MAEMAPAPPLVAPAQRCEVAAAGPLELENQRRTLNIGLLSEAISSLILLSVRFHF